MKTKLLLIIAIALTANVFSQIPNSGFESWSTIGSYEDPDGWATMNILCTGPFYSCTKSTDHYPASVGNYSIRVENNTSLTQMTGAYGMAMTNAFDYPFKPAFPVIGHPTSLTGYFKYNSVNMDTMFIKVILFDSGTIVSNADFVVGVSVPSWTSFSLPLPSYITADSATILVSAFFPNGPVDGPNGNSVLNVDNINFDNLIASVPTQVAKNTPFNLYPNPAIDVVMLNIQNLNNDMLSLNIYNVIGELIRSEPVIQNEQQINIGDLINGIYVVEIKGDRWSEKQKLIIQK